MIGQLSIAVRGHMLGLLAVAATLSTTPAQARIQMPVGRWVVDYGDLRCTLARRIGNEGSPVLILTSYIGRDEPEILIAADVESRMPRLQGSVEVILNPSGQSGVGQVENSELSSGRAYRIRGLSHDFIDRFAESTSLRLRDQSQVVEVPIPGSRTAVAALRTCNEDLLSSWGIDMVRRAALSRRPRLISGTITDRDYPQAAIQAHAGGIVVTRIDVAPDGQVSNCTIVVRTNFPVLNTTTCSLIRDRYRYEPALDANGSPVASQWVSTVRWTMAN